MAVGNYANTGGLYFSIIGGKLARKAEQDAEGNYEAGAKKREYELKDGTKGSKVEVYAPNITGKLMGVTFRDTDFGKQCSVRFEDGEIVNMGTDSRYFQDFAKKLKNIDLSKPVSFAPFDFEKEGKQSTGVSIKQDGVKIEKYYSKKDEKGNWKTFHGFPLPDKTIKNPDKDDWKAYFISVKKFLVKEVESVTFANEIARDLGGELVYDTTKNDDVRDIRAEDIDF